MNNIEIDEKLTQLVKSERKITREILELIVKAEQQRLPQERGFKDTYDWLIRGHGYSGGAANRRIQAARRLKEIPEAAEKVESGDINLTTMWQANRTIRAQQKSTGVKVTLVQKKEALKRIEGKTSEVAEKELLTLFPEGDNFSEKLVNKQNGGLGLSIELSAQEAEELKRTKELLSHAMPGASFSQIISRLAKEYNDRNDPLRKPELIPTPARVMTRKRRMAVLQKANGECEYQDPITKRVCGGRYQPESDHVFPKALGGHNQPSNLRCLCRKHNQLMAEKTLGRSFMEAQKLKLKS